MKPWRDISLIDKLIIIAIVVLCLVMIANTCRAQITDITPTPCFDCDDTRADVHPRAPELCDGVDNDCDGLVDEGCPVLPVVTIRALKLSVLESGSVAVRIDRTGPITNNLKVFYLVAGTASPGADYTPLKGFATIQSNKAFATFKIKTMDDTNHEQTENVGLWLTVSNTYQVGNPGATVVNILDND